MWRAFQVIGVLFFYAHTSYRIKLKRILSCYQLVRAYALVA